MSRQNKENGMLRILQHKEDQTSSSKQPSVLIEPFKWLTPTGGNIIGRERGQALLRVFVSTIVALYLMHAHGPCDLTHEIPPWVVMAGYALFSIALFWRILRSQISPASRRYIANLADMSFISYAMIASGETGMPLFVLYLWVTFGNGFRFGIPALIVSAILSIAGFSMVFALTEAWQTQAALP